MINQKICFDVEAFLKFSERTEIVQCTSFIKCLTFCIPLEDHELQYIGKGSKCSVEVMLPSQLISDQIFRISDVKASDICINFAKPFLLRLPLKITSPPKLCISESKRNSIYQDYHCPNIF